MKRLLLALALLAGCNDELPPAPNAMTVGATEFRYHPTCNPVYRFVDPENENVIYVYPGYGMAVVKK